MLLKTHDYIDTDGFQGHNWVFFSRIAVTINNIYDKKCLDFAENPEVGCTCFSI